MISVEMEDVLAVLQLCKPYIIGIIAALVIGIVIMIACRRMSRGKRFLIRGEAAIAMVLAVVVCVNMICFGPMSTLIGLATGNGTLSDETNEEAAEVAEEIMEDGIVLLKNESLLPLNETKKLNIFGWESINPAYGGAGSGGINDLYDIVSLNQGLENAGFSINQELVDFYNNYGADNPEMSIQKQSWTLPEPPVDTYSDELIKSAKEYSDVAVVVLSRKAGEGHNDIPMDVRKAAYDNNSDEYDDFPEGEHYLQLSQTERDMVDMVCSNFDNVIVVYNGANQFELGFADEYPQIKSVVWCPGTGNVGFNALGKVFSGEVNPSGKTPDTFIYDMTTAPWWNNAEKTEYTNLADLAVEGMNAGTAQVYAPAFTNYVEGIYVGYKYYETAAQEGAIDYDKTVQYPFGYGLSYTEFEQKMGELEEKDGQISVDVEVTNTGDVAGKDVVEVYYNPPYTNGGIEKSAVNLLDFAKTKELVAVCKEKGMSLEAEVGSIGGEEDGVIGMGECADPNECKMIADLGVDMLAAGIGNIHGVYPANWQGLSFETLAAVQELTGELPLVLHGGTGIPADQIKKAIDLGVSKINVNTECQLAFAAATRKYIEAGKDLEGKGFDPRKLLAPGAEAIKATVKEKMELFGSVGKAE